MNKIPGFESEILSEKKFTEKATSISPVVGIEVDMMSCSCFPSLI